MKKVIHERARIWGIILGPSFALGLCLLAPHANAQSLRENAEHARSILREGLDARDSVVRIEAIAATSMIGNHELVLARLESLLLNGDIQVRLAVIHALADLASPASIEPLRNVLQNDKVPEVVFAAAQALEKLHDPDGTKALVEVFEGKRKSSSNMIQKQERQTAAQFHSFPSAMMFLFSKGSGYIPVPGVGEGYSALTMLLHDTGLSDRAVVVLLLSHSNDAGTTELLCKALVDKDWSVRASAAQVIAQTARVGMRDDLLPLFDDKNRKVRYRAAGAFLRLAWIQYPQQTL